MRANSRVATRIVGAILLVTGVVAFVVRHHASTTFRHQLHQQQLGSRRGVPSKSTTFLQATAGDDGLKSMLGSSSYDLETSKAYAGGAKRLKNAGVSKSTPSYDLSTDPTTSTTSPPVQDATTTITTPPPPPVVVDTPPPPPSAEKAIESVTKSLEETIKSSSTSSATPPKGVGDDSLPSLSIPSDVQETIQKPFSSMNNFLKSTQDSIKEAQKQAAEQSTSVSGISSGGGSSTSGSGPPDKVPTLGELFMNSLSSQKDTLGEAVSKKATTTTTSVDIKLPEVDVKLPSFNGIQPPEFKLPETGVLSLKTDVTLPEAGKALPFTDYIKAKAVGALPSDPGTSMESTLADAKDQIWCYDSQFLQIDRKGCTRLDKDA